MAARGRGRGRGGRGGRGGGGGGGLGPPGARDDDGNLVQMEINHGPPPLFPVSGWCAVGVASCVVVCELCGGLCVCCVRVV